MALQPVRQEMETVRKRRWGRELRKKGGEGQRKTRRRDIGNKTQGWDGGKRKGQVPTSTQMESRCQV